LDFLPEAPSRKYVSERLGELIRRDIRQSQLPISASPDPVHTPSQLIGDHAAKLMLELCGGFYHLHALCFI